jgi:hypothetical protein
MPEKLIPVANNSSSGQSQSLPQSLQHQFETQFGQDFSDVRVHQDSQATVAARAVGATAFATGNDIFFAPGNYQPHTEAGNQLIAHELSHVVQQRQGQKPDVPQGMTKVETEE